MMARYTIRTRLALQFSALMATIVAVTLAIVLFSSLHSMRESFDATVGEVFERVARHLDAGPEGIALRRTDPTAELPGRDLSREIPAEVRTFDGKRLYASSAWSDLGLRAPLESPGTPETRSLHGEGKRFCVMSGPLRLGGKDLVLTVAVDEAKVWEEFMELFWTIVVAAPFALVLAGLGGYWMAGRALKPVDLIIQRTEKITASKLGERLPVANAHDELGRLAGVLNGLFDRLEQSFEQLRRFTSDASHELRTPLQAIRSLGEVALQRQQESEYYRNVVSNILEETDRMTKLTQSLLLLSRADAGRVPLTRTRVSLGKMVEEVVSLLEVLAEEKTQKLKATVDGNPEVTIDPVVFRQAVLNLVDNAIKYSGTGCDIRVSVRSVAEGHELSVTDNGPGIPAEHRERIFERFYRVEKSRSRELGGAGLGLAITKWAVEAHGGRLFVESRPGMGSTFRVLLPAGA